MDANLVAPLSYARVRDDLRHGSVAGLLAALRDRTEAVEPRVRALVDESDRPGRHADAADRLGGRGAEAPPLYGVPIGVKDIFHVDGMPTFAGSTVPPDELTGAQGTCVSRLMRAGAVVFAKTVTAEFAGLAPGPTRNPHDIKRTPGGSSSGSAAGVAAGLFPVALGTQTVGSVIRPAAFCGVVGFKPTYGRIPTDGVIAFSRSVDTIGLLACDIDATTAASAVLLDGWDGATAESSAAAQGIRGAAVPDGPYLAQTDDRALEAFERDVGTLARAGLVVRRVPMLDDIEQISHRHRRLTAAEMAEAHEPWFDRYHDRYASWTAATIREGRTVGADELADARAGLVRLRERLHRQMDEAGVDVLLCPSATGPAPEGEATGNPAMNLPWTHAGMPALSVPGTPVDGLPLGIQCVGRFGDDERLLAWAAGVFAAGA